MTRSMRVMFVGLIAAMVVGYVQLRSKNDALAAHTTSVAP